MIREDRELLAELAQINTAMAPLAMRIMDDSASTAEQTHYARRLIAVGERLQHRASEAVGTVIEGEVLANETADPSGAYRRASLGTVSDVWETRNRLLLEYLEKLADQLRSKESITPAALEEQTVRLLAGVLMLLRQHRVNKWGKCQYFGWTRWAWRLGYKRRQQCTVYRAFSFALNQPLDVVLWQLEDHKTRSRQ